MTLPVPPMLMSATAGTAAMAATGMMPDSSFPYGLSMRFKVSVDGLSLGSWSACKGLKVELKVIRVAEGGNYWYERILPDRIAYTPITLERAVHPQESQQVQDWLDKVASQWMNYSGDPSYSAGTAVITLLGVTSQEVMSWTLTGVYPVSWSGPSLSATENKVAIETLELAHQGFLPSSPAVPSP
jgi:phage tail-like protein